MSSKKPLVNKYSNIHVIRYTKFYWPLLFAAYPSGELVFRRVIYWTHQLNRAAKLKLGLRLMNELFALLCPGNRKKSLHMRCALRSATINAMSLKTHLTWVTIVATAIRRKPHSRTGEPLRQTLVPNQWQLPPDPCAPSRRRMDLVHKPFCCMMRHTAHDVDLDLLDTTSKNKYTISQKQLPNL